MGDADVRSARRHPRRIPTVPGRSLLQVLCCSLAFCNVGQAFRDGPAVGAGAAAFAPSFSRGALGTRLGGLARRDAGCLGVCSAPPLSLLRTTRRPIAPRMVFGKENTFEEAEQVADRMFRKFRRQDQVEVSGVPEGAVVQGSGSGNKGDEKISFEVDLKRPLGLILREIAGYGVYVDAVTAEGSAKAAGVQVFLPRPPLKLRLTPFPKPGSSPWQAGDSKPLSPGH